MTNHRGIVETTKTNEFVIDCMADFRNAAEWDPGHGQHFTRRPAMGPDLVPAIDFSLGSWDAQCRSTTRPRDFERPGRWC